MSLLDDITAKACQEFSDDVVTYGDSFMPEAAINGIVWDSAKLTPAQWAVLIVENPEYLTTTHNFSASTYSGTALVSAQDVLECVLRLHLRDELESHRNWIVNEGSKVSE